MKFIAAFAMKVGEFLVTSRQEWTGPLAGCGKGNYIDSMATFVFKNYMTDAKHSEYSEAYTCGSHMIGVSEETKRCLEITGGARLVITLPLDPTNVIIYRTNSLHLQGDYLLYDLETKRPELLLRADPDAQISLFHTPRLFVGDRDLLTPAFHAKNLPKT